jgi:hypothetical protein
MGATTLIAFAVAALAVLASVALAGLLVRERRRTAEVLAAGRTEVETLRARVDELASRVTAASTPATAPAQFVITDVGQPRPEPTVSDRVVLSATIGEPLVKVAAFSYGVRRALSARSRNHIWFEMRREVRAVRKRRRREVKEYLRQARAEERVA